jgi:hypothetical protein
VTGTFDIPTNEADKPLVTVSMSGAGISATSTGGTSVPGNNPPGIPTLVSPADGQTVLGTSVVLSWTKVVDPDGDAVSYQVATCTNQDFTGCPPVDVPAPTAAAQKAGLGSLGAGIILFGFVAGGSSRRARKGLLMVAALLLSGTLFVACGGGGGGSTPTQPTTNTQMNFTVSGLAAKTTYFWKVIVNDARGGQSTSVTRSFKTQ